MSERMRAWGPGGKAPALPGFFVSEADKEGQRPSLRCATNEIERGRNKRSTNHDYPL